jgi:plasmid stabilization system protein ParE
MERKLADAEGQVEAAAADRDKAAQRAERAERQARDAEALLADNDRWGHLPGLLRTICVVRHSAPQQLLARAGAAWRRMAGDQWS